MHSFLQVLAAFLPALLKAEAGLGSTASGLQEQQKLFQQASTQQSWVGQSSNAQQNRAQMFVDTTGKVLASIARAQTQTAAGTAQMQAAQMTVQSTVNVARGAGFLVLPNGTVRLSPAQRAATAKHPGARLILEKIALKLTAAIQAGMAQSAASDAQTAASLIEIATQALSSLFQKDSGAASAALPAVEIPPATPVTSTPIDTTPLTPLPAIGAGADLAPLDAGGGGGGLAGAGGGALGGAAALGGAGSLGGVSGAGGLGSAALGAASGGLVGGAGAAAGRGAAGAPMMPMGAGAGGARDGARAGRQGWLQEDEDPWETGDAPDGVLS